MSGSFLPVTMATLPSSLEPCAAMFVFSVGTVERESWTSRPVPLIYFNRNIDRRCQGGVGLIRSIVGLKPELKAVPLWARASLELFFSRDAQVNNKEMTTRTVGTFKILVSRYLDYDATEYMPRVYVHGNSVPAGCPSSTVGAGHNCKTKLVME